MAKGKRAVALFEVIHSAKKPQGQTASGLFRTPKWWFKGRAKAADRRTPALVAAPEVEHPPQIGAEPIHAASHSHSPAVDSHASAARGGVDVDRDRQQITLRLNFHSAIVTGFAVLTVVVVAFAIGRKVSSGPATASAGAISSEEIRSGPARPDVLDVTAGVTPAAPSRADAGKSNTAPPSGASANRPAAVRVDPPAPATAASGERVIGMQYVIIHSFLDDKADKTAAFFRENGIDCTVETGLPGWGSQWRSVVGTQGFARASGPEYDRYFNRILQVCDKHALVAKGQTFKPIAVRWQGKKS